MRIKTQLLHLVGLISPPMSKYNAVPQEERGILANVTQVP